MRVGCRLARREARASGGAVHRLSWIAPRFQADVARRLRRWQWRELLEPRRMRVVAVDAQQVHPLAVPAAGAPAVDAVAPVAQLLAVTLAAQLVRVIEADQTS